MSTKRTALVSVVILALVVAIAIALLGRHPEYSDQVVGIYAHYDESVESVLIAGHYDQADSDITSQRFPSVRHGQSSVKVHLLRFPVDRGLISSDEVLEVMASHGLRPAEARELLSLGASHPDLQRQGPILALASSCPPWPQSGGRCILCLDELYEEDGEPGRRQASLRENVSTSWNGNHFRFAAVAKDTTDK